MIGNAVFVNSGVGVVPRGAYAQGAVGNVFGVDIHRVVGLVFVGSVQSVAHRHHHRAVHGGIGVLTSIFVVGGSAGHGPYGVGKHGYFRHVLMGAAVVLAGAGGGAYRFRRGFGSYRPAAVVVLGKGKSYGNVAVNGGVHRFARRRAGGGRGRFYRPDGSVAQSSYGLFGKLAAIASAKKRAFRFESGLFADSPRERVLSFGKDDSHRSVFGGINYTSVLFVRCGVFRLAPYVRIGQSGKRHFFRFTACAGAFCRACGGLGRFGGDLPFAELVFVACRSKHKNESKDEGQRK